MWYMIIEIVGFKLNKLSFQWRYKNKKGKETFLRKHSQKDKKIEWLFLFMMILGIVSPYLKGIALWNFFSYKEKRKNEKLFFTCKILNLTLNVLLKTLGKIKPPIKDDFLKNIDY